WARIGAVTKLCRGIPSRLLPEARDHAQQKPWFPRRKVPHVTQASFGLVHIAGAGRYRRVVGPNFRPSGEALVLGIALDPADLEDRVDRDIVEYPWGMSG